MPPIYRAFSLKNNLTYGPIIGGQVKGTIVIPNSKLLEILKAKYSIDESIRESKEDDHIEDGVLSDCEASEASGGKSDRERPKRVQTSEEASLSSKKPRGSK